MIDAEDSTSATTGDSTQRTPVPHAIAIVTIGALAWYGGHLSQNSIIALNAVAFCCALRVIMKDRFGAAVGPIWVVAVAFCPLYTLRIDRGEWLVVDWFAVFILTGQASDVIARTRRLNFLSRIASFVILVSAFALMVIALGSMRCYDR